MKFNIKFTLACCGVLAPLAVVVLHAAVVRATAPAGRYTIASGAVTDNQTKLVWQQALSALYTQPVAMAYCPTLAGGTWRAPSMKELQTLVDDTQLSPAIDTTAFPNATAEAFWTSTLLAGSSSLAYNVDFTDGKTNAVSRSISSRVRCVR